MSELPAVIETEDLKSRLENAIDVDTEIEVAGEKKELDSRTKDFITNRNVADTIVDYIAEKAVNIGVIEKTELMYGSGDTGRQTQLYLIGHENTEKDELLDIANELKYIIEPVFPTEFLVGVKHGFKKEGGDIVETDRVSVFLVYRVRTASKPSKPSGDSTEIV